MTWHYKNWFRGLWSTIEAKRPLLWNGKNDFIKQQPQHSIGKGTDVLANNGSRRFCKKSSQHNETELSMGVDTLKAMLNQMSNYAFKCGQWISSS